MLLIFVGIHHTVAFHRVKTRRYAQDTPKGVTHNGLFAQCKGNILCKNYYACQYKLYTWILLDSKTSRYAISRRDKL